MIQRGSQLVRIPDDRDAGRDIVAAEDPALLKSQEEMGNQGLPPDHVSAAKSLNRELEAPGGENQRRALQEEEEEERLAQLQRERKTGPKAELERKRRAEEEERLRKPEQQRQQLLQLEREKEAQRQREMRALEEEMQRMRLEEEDRRERDRKERKKQLDKQIFSLDYDRLARAKANGRISTNLWTITSIEMCDHCFLFLENEEYYGNNGFSFPSKASGHVDCYRPLTLQPNSMFRMQHSEAFRPLHNLLPRCRSLLPRSTLPSGLMQYWHCYLLRQWNRWPAALRSMSSKTRASGPRYVQRNLPFFSSFFNYRRHKSIAPFYRPAATTALTIYERQNVGRTNGISALTVS